MNVTRLAEGVYRVEQDRDAHIVYVAGPPEDRWAFCNGEVYRIARETAGRQASRADSAQSLMAPMPATVLKVLVTPGAAVRTGDTIVILEAMKMELPLRAPGDAVVAAVHCREGELVEAGAVLVDLK